MFDGRGHRFGGALSIDPGIDLAQDPAGSASPPVLTWWQAEASDDPFASVIDFVGLTSISISMRFILSSGGTSYSTPNSTPAQTSPHAVSASTTIPADRGKWYDLSINSPTTGTIFIGIGLVYVPAVDEGIWIGGTPS